MAEKKIQENPIPDEAGQAQMPKDMAQKLDKSTTVPLPVPVVAPRPFMPSFTKATPNDLYRRLLPAVLFLLTFVTVMTMLLVYMDTVALGAAQFRLNMSRDYELSRIPQESPTLVSYVRQLHLASRAEPPAPSPQPDTEPVRVIDRVFGREVMNGTFVEWAPRGPRSATARALLARGWRGLAVRAAATDFLRLPGTALLACLSNTPHPREVTFQSEGGSGFSSRVLCLPLYPVLLAARAARAHLLSLAGPAAPAALAHLPYSRVHLAIIQVEFEDNLARNQTTEFLATKNYTVAASFDNTVMFALNTTNLEPIE